MMRPAAVPSHSNQLHVRELARTLAKLDYTDRLDPLMLAQFSHTAVSHGRLYSDANSQEPHLKPTPQ